MARYWFGPAGKPISLKGDLLKAPEHLRNMGLNCMEYEAVRGVNISEDRARRLGEEAHQHKVLMSLHAPYYINLAGRKNVVESSVERLKQAVQASSWMGAYVVVFHPGYYRDAPSKKDAVEMVVNALKKVDEYRIEIGATSVWLGPETTGKTTQIGSLEEVVEISRRVEGVRPVVDFAHLYARKEGKFLKDTEDVLKIVELLAKELGEWSLKPLHVHFSKIEYGKGGERKHVELSDPDHGPSFEIVIKGLCEAGVDAVIISESPVLEQDALIMKDICTHICGASCIVE